MSDAQAVVDSNIIIYAVADPAGACGHYLSQTNFATSVVTRIEVLGFPRLTSTERDAIVQLLDAGVELPLSADVVERAIELRQARRMSLGDCVVAATALVHGLTLATRNVADFQWITALTVDPVVP